MITKEEKELIKEIELRNLKRMFKRQDNERLKLVKSKRNFHSPMTDIEILLKILRKIT